MAGAEGKSYMTTRCSEEKVSKRRMRRAKQDALCYDGVRLAESPGKGLGVFAERDFQKGDVVTFYPAHAVYVEDVDAGDGRTAWRAAPGYSSEHMRRMINDYCMDVPGGIVAADPDRVDQGLGHMINDGARSSSPATERLYNRLSPAKENAAPHTLLCGTEFLVQIRATRDIKTGEELFFSYGLPYWRKKYGGD